jgi:hypothetical protein
VWGKKRVPEGILLTRDTAGALTSLSDQNKPLFFFANKNKQTMLRVLPNDYVLKAQKDSNQG